jgi:glycosyltransferase involved in cell wall biosynthesis
VVHPEIIQHVDFFGQIDDFSLYRHYFRARCLVFPSFFEASGLPPIEAMTCGCPVVTSDIPALRERCGDAALYCNPADPDSIADQILKLLKNETVYEEFRRRGTEWARRFSWNECARETFAVVKELLT